MFPKPFLTHHEKRHGLYCHGLLFINEASQYLKGRKPQFCMTQTNQINFEKFIITFGTFKCHSRRFERIFPAASSTILTCFLLWLFLFLLISFKAVDSVSTKGKTDKVRTFSKSNKECSYSLGNRREP